MLVRRIFDTHKHFDADELVTDLTRAGRRVSARPCIARSACSWKLASCASFVSPTAEPDTITATHRTTTCIAPSATRWSNSATTRFAAFVNPSVWNTDFA